MSKVQGMETYNDVYIRVRRALKNAGISEPEMESRFIVAHGMGKTREQLLAMGKIYATDERIRKKIEDSLERRMKGEPLAYVLGEWEFYGLTVIVNKHVLIPRPDTEILASEVIKILQRKKWKTRVLDLCSGSGCIGLAIAKNNPGSNVVLADNDGRALAVCKQNTAACNLSRNTTIIQADALKPPPSLFGEFDVLVSNPPYIPTGDIESLDSSVKDYEPRKALDGGEDGLDYFRAIISKWAKIIKPGGNLALELGIGQAPQVRDMLRDNGIGAIEVYRDTLGIERVIIGRVER